MIRACLIAFTVVAAIALSGLIAFYFLYWPKLQQRNTALIAHVVEEGVMSYHKDYEAFPSGEHREVIAALLGKNTRAKSYVRPEFRQFLDEQGHVHDAWKRDFRFETGPSGNIMLRSAGPNGSFDDEDDVTSADALE